MLLLQYPLRVVSLSSLLAHLWWQIHSCWQWWPMTGLWLFLMYTVVMSQTLCTLPVTEPMHGELSLLLSSCLPSFHYLFVSLTSWITFSLNILSSSLLLALILIWVKWFFSPLLPLMRWTRLWSSLPLTFLFWSLSCRWIQLRGGKKPSPLVPHISWPSLSTMGQFSSSTVCPGIKTSGKRWKCPLSFIQ